MQVIRGFEDMFGNRNKPEQGLGEQAFRRAQAQSTATAAFLLRAEDLYPVYCSASFKAFFGVEPARLADDAEVLFTLMDELEALRLRRQVSTWLAEHSSTPLSTPVAFTREGEETPRHVRATLSWTDGGTNVLAEFANVEEEAKAVAEAQQRAQEMEGESRSTMNFLNSMSHEIRTPLNGIIGSLDLAKIHAANPELLTSDLTKAKELSGLLLGLINDILDMSRIESGKVELESHPVALRSFAGNIQSMFTPTAEAKNITFTVEMADCEDEYIMCDELRLSQVIVNFLSNAFKFTDPEGTVEVLFRGMYRTPEVLHLMVRVRDTGCGMSQEFLKNIFKPFEQENASTARTHGGSGLGMAIADNLVRLMGGRIVVSSEEGAGSDFCTYLTFNLPSPEECEQLRAQAEAAHDAPAAEAQEDPLCGMSLLLAEDNELNAEIAIEFLEEMGATVTRVSDGAQAVSQFRKAPAGTFDSILMDIQMPVLDGWEATKQIRALSPNEAPDAATVPIFALSANAFVEDMRRSEEAGMNGHISKPIDFTKLSATLLAAVKG